MKRFVTTIFATSVVVILIVFLMGSQGDSGSSLKIAFVDANKITQGYPKMIELNKQYQSDYGFYQQKLAEMSKELEDMVNSGASQSDIEAKQKDILAKKQQYEKLLQDEYQPKMQQVFNEMAEKIESYAQMMGYDFILTKQAFLYGNDIYDITEQLLNYLKAE